MSKKMMLLALAAVSAAMFALPSVASAWETDPAGASFIGTTTTTSTLKATGEPTITCEGASHVTGSYDATSKTTGSITLDFTACHVSIFGFTVACTTGASGNTIASSGTFHNVTVGSTTPVQITPVPTTIKCGSTTPILVTGAINGEITSPACGASSETATIDFNEAGGLTAETEGSKNPVPATETAHATLTFTPNITKTC